MTVDASVRQRIADNVAQTRERIAAAATRSGRSAAAVQLVAVTKYVDADWTHAVWECGCHELGESRPQQLWSKAEELADTSIHWHLIGHLQRNKVERVLPHVTLLHSLDSPRLWHAIEHACQQLGRELPVLLEVNISGDESKHGFAPAELERFVMDVVMPHDGAAIKVQGLMAMASLEGGPERARCDFRALRQLRDQVAAATAGQLLLPELSMGMSDDFEVAIEEGATLVRVGSVLFEGTGA